MQNGSDGRADGNDGDTAGFGDPMQLGQPSFRKFGKQSQSGDDECADADEREIFLTLHYNTTLLLVAMI